MVRRGLEEWSWNLDNREPFTSFLRPVPQLPLYPNCTFFILNVTEKKNSRENQWNQNRLTRSTKMTNFSYADGNKKIITFPVFQAQGSSCWHWAHALPGLCPYTCFVSTCISNSYIIQFFLFRWSPVRKLRDVASYMTTKESRISLIWTMNLMNSQWMQLDMEMCLILWITV